VIAVGPHNQEHVVIMMVVFVGKLVAVLAQILVLMVDLELDQVCI